MKRARAAVPCLLAACLLAGPWSCDRETVRLRNLDPVMPEEGVGPPRLKPGPAGPRVHIVRPGDTLFGIAAQIYGDGHKWSRIYNANRGTLRSPQSLRVGMELVIP